MCAMKGYDDTECTTGRAPKGISLSSPDPTTTYPSDIYVCSVSELPGCLPPFRLHSLLRKRLAQIRRLTRHGVALFGNKTTLWWRCIMTTLNLPHNSCTLS